MPTSTVIESTTLTFRDDRSDKVYKATIEKCDEGYTVNCSWGRRGSAMQSATQTKDPVSLAMATKIYEKKIKEKTNKGYRILGHSYRISEMVDFFNKNDTIPVANTTNPLNPQCNLLNPVDDDHLESLMMNNKWVMQEKMDGVRLMIKRNNPTEFIGYSRTGREVAVPLNIVEALQLLGAPYFFMDGELVGDVYYAFDLIETHIPIQNQDYNLRKSNLASILSQSKPTSSVVCVKDFITLEEKSKEFKRIKDEGGEGVVFKKIAATYQVSRPSSGGDYLKFKFYKTCSAIVSKINDRRSVGLSLCNTGYKSTPIGNCTIPVNHPIPNEGAVVDVRYLYARLPSHALYQPSYLGERSDIRPWECVLSQLKYKTGDEDEG